MVRKIACSSILTILVQMLIVCPIEAQNLNQKFQIVPFVKFDFYGWKEFADNNDELLKESGMLFGFGAKPRLSFFKQNDFYAESDFQIFFGKVDYDGFLQNVYGQTSPYKSLTADFELELSAYAAYIFSLSKKFQLTPKAGYGFEYWHRDLDNGGKNGYDEKYTTFLGNIGVEGTYLLNRDIQFFSLLWLKVPLSLSESSDLASRGQGGPSDISLSPGKNPRIVFEVGSSVYRFFGTMFFETWTLSKSNVDKGFHQPESTRKLFGFRLGYGI